MIGHGIIRTDTEPTWGLPPAGWVETTNPLHYLFAEELVYVGEDLQPPDILQRPELDNPYMVGWWDETGAELAPTDVQAYEVVRPLGNRKSGGEEDPMAGAATPDLYYHHWVGMPDRLLGDTASPDPVMVRYPACCAPFKMELRHKDFGGGSWGWRVEVIGGWSSRDAASRQMTSETAPQTFPLILRASEFYPGETLYSAEYDEGDAFKIDRKLTCRYQGKDEGFWFLPANSTGETRLFWAKDQDDRIFYVDTNNDGVDDHEFYLSPANELVFICETDVADSEFVATFADLQVIAIVKLRNAVRDAIRDLP